MGALSAPVVAGDEDSEPKRPVLPKAGVDAAVLKAAVLAGAEAAPKLAKPPLLAAEEAWTR